MAALDPRGGGVTQEPANSSADAAGDGACGDFARGFTGFRLEFVENYPSRGWGGVRRGYCQGGCGGFLPQNVEPRVNHWRPDAKAKSVGVVDLRTPLTAPNSRPDTPVDGCQLCCLDISCRWLCPRDEVRQ